LQERSLERDILGKELSMLKEEAKSSLEELNTLRYLKDEQEATIKTLNLKVQTLMTQFTDLKHSLSDDELEKENLRKQVLLLRGDLRKEVEIIASIEKRLKDNNANLTVSESTTMININKSKRTPRGAHGSQMVANLNGNSKPCDVSFPSSQIRCISTILFFLYVYKYWVCNRTMTLHARITQNNKQFLDLKCRALTIENNRYYRLMSSKQFR